MMQWNEYETLLWFSYCDLEWSQRDFIKEGITDKPSPLFVYYDDYDYNQKDRYENPIFKRIRDLLGIQINVGFLSCKITELNWAPPHIKEQFKNHTIHLSSCKRNAIMIDNYPDPTDQHDGIE